MPEGPERPEGSEREGIGAVAPPLVLPFGESQPRIAPDAFVAPGATLIGDVEIAAQASIWFGCVLRGDVCSIRIGARSNIQDGTVIHVTSSGLATQVGEDVTVGHRCLLHACTLEPHAFVGMGATVLDAAILESDAMLAAGALLTPGKRVPAGELWAGVPARRVRRLSEQEILDARARVSRYVDLAQTYRSLRSTGAFAPSAR